MSSSLGVNIDYCKTIVFHLKPFLAQVYYSSCFKLSSNFERDKFA